MSIEEVSNTTNIISHAFDSFMLLLDLLLVALQLRTHELDIVVHLGIRILELRLKFPVSRAMESRSPL